MESVTKMLIASLEDMGVCVNYDAVWEKYIYDNGAYVVSESNIPVIDDTYTLPPMYLVSATIYSSEPDKIYLEFSKSLRVSSTFEYTLDSDQDSLPQQGIIFREEGGVWVDAGHNWTSSVLSDPNYPNYLMLTLSEPATEDIVSNNRLQLVGAYENIKGISGTDSSVPVGQFTRAVTWYRE